MGASTPGYFGGGFKNVVKNLMTQPIPGTPMAQRQSEQKIAEAQEARAQQQADISMHEHLINDLGARPVVNGMVKQEVPLTGPGVRNALMGDQGGSDQSSSFDPESNSYTGGDQGSGSLSQQLMSSMAPQETPQQGGSQTTTIVRKPEKSQVVSWKDHTGNQVEYELPTEEEQMARAQRIAMSKAQATAQGTATGTALGQAAGAPALGAAQGQEAQAKRGVDLSSRGIDVPAELSSVVSGPKMLPEELPGAQLAAGQRRDQAIQELSGAPSVSPLSYQQWAAKHPELNPPPTLDRNWVKATLKSNVPTTQQPEYDLKVAQANAVQAYSNSDPKSLDDQVDAIVPPKDPMNASTKVMVRSAYSRGDIAAIPKILQDAYDQRGRVQVAKENAQNKLQVNLGDWLGTGNAEGQNKTAEGIANYNINAQTALSRLPPIARQKLLEQVMTINPDFHQEYYNNFNKTEMDATTGKIGTSANALNTMMGHLSVLNDASDALKNNNLQVLNRIANTFGVQTGQTPVTTYNTIVHRLGPEVTKAYLASGGSVGERGTNEQDFDPKLGPDQIKQNIGVSALLADSKIKALQDQYSRGTYGRGKQKLISDEAEQARQRLTTQAPAALTGGAPIVQRSKSTGQYRYSTDEGKTWQAGQPPTGKQ